MGWLSSNWWLSPNCWLSSSWWLSSSNQYTSIGDYLSLPLCQLSRTGWTAECAFALFHLPLKYHLKLFCQEQAKTTGCFSSIGKPLFPFAVNFFFSPVLVGCRMVIALFWEPPVCVAGVDAFWDWEWRNWSILVTQWGSRQSSCLPLQWPKDRKNWAILLRRSSWPGEWFFFWKDLSPLKELWPKRPLWSLGMQLWCERVSLDYPSTVLCGGSRVQPKTPWTPWNFLDGNNLQLPKISRTGRSLKRIAFDMRTSDDNV